MKNSKWKRLIFLLVVFSISCKNDDHEQPLIFVVEVVGIDRDVDFAIGRLSNQHGVHKVYFEIDRSQNLLTGNFLNIGPGAYTLTISVYEGENLISDPQARGTLYNGVESHEPIEITVNQSQLIVQGPDIPSNEANYEPAWSERYFYTFSDENVTDSDIVWSTPEQPCELNLRILPETVNPQPEFVYIDYFLHSATNGSVALGYEECQNCDPFARIDSFFENLSQDGSAEHCQTADWDIADSMMILDFGDGSDEEIYFFMKWDKEGTVLDIYESSNISTSRSQSLYDTRSKGIYLP